MNESLLSLFKKRATVSDSLIKICIFLEVLDFHCFSYFYAQERIAPIALCSVTLFYRATGAIRSCRSLQKSDCERIAPNALYKRATVSNYLQLLLTEEGRDRFAIFQEQITLSLSKNKQFAQKTKEQIPNPDNTTNLSGL